MATFLGSGAKTLALGATAFKRGAAIGAARAYAGEFVRAADSVLGLIPTVNPAPFQQYAFPRRMLKMSIVMFLFVACSLAAWIAAGTALSDHNIRCSECTLRRFIMKGSATSMKTPKGIAEHASAGSKWHV